MLATNHVFHGGLWGTLHNDSVTPRVDVLALDVAPDGALEITLERPVGPETYGAFIVDVRVFDAHGDLVRRYDAASLAALDANAIDNRWLVQVETGPHGLVVPLGARATVRLSAVTPLATDALRIELEDVSGRVWQNTFPIAPDAARQTPSPHLRASFRDGHGEAVR